ncbi:Transmembrane protein 184-like protein [Colletotrichum siamense]|nr:Transmembrane protein 184-like protein [Colletotrichum siamense]
MCPDSGLNLPISDKPIVGALSFQGFLILAGGILTMTSCSMSFYQIFRHATNYTKPLEQKQIIRICLLVPIYTLSSFLSIVFYKHHVYLAGIYLLYEACALVAFYALCCAYLDTDHHRLATSWDKDGLKKWFFTRPFAACVPALKGSYYDQPAANAGWRRFNRMWLCIYQYPFMKLLVTIATYVTESMGVLCSEEGGTKYADFWLHTVVSVAILITAMHCLFQFYYQSQELLEPHKPVLKFLAIKIVVFLSLMQGFVLDAIVGRDNQPLGPTDAISYPSLAIGVPNLLLCLEMFGIGIMHLYAYPWAPYVARNGAGVLAATENDGDEDGGKKGSAVVDVSVEEAQSQGGFLGWKAYVDALNFSDFAVALYRGVGWVFMRKPGRG